MAKRPGTYVRTNAPLPKSEWGISVPEIVTEEHLPNSTDTIIHARFRQWHAFLIWSPTIGLLRSPWSHEDDRCEVVAWGREPEDIQATAAWTTKSQVLWARKKEVIDAYLQRNHEHPQEEQATDRREG